MIFASLVEAPEKLNFEEEIVRRSFSSKYSLPPQLLDRLSKVVEFALVSGAAREITQQDLFHGHLLYMRGENDLASPTAILLHTQEMESWSPEAFRKRNVVIFRNTEPLILSCSRGISRRQYFPPEERSSICTVDEKDLGLVNPADVYILRADKLSKSSVSRSALNIRIVNGQRILFVGFGLTLKNGRLALP